MIGPVPEQMLLQSSLIRKARFLKQPHGCVMIGIHADSDLVKIELLESIPHGQLDRF